MKNILITTLLISSVAFTSQGQSDGCSAATVIGVTADCLSPTAGTTMGATQTIPGCVGNADDDVWYQFVATSAAAQIVVVPSGGMDPVVQLFSGGCGVLASLDCHDGGLTGGTETVNVNSLTIGNTYRIRIYHYGAGSGTGTFTICLTTPPPPPVNNLCGSPTGLTVNSACSFVTATTDGATQSYVGCAGNADDDVWFSFTATNSLQNILVSPIDNLDLVFQVYSGSCGSLTSLACVDNSLTGQDEQSDIVGLVPGQVYLIRVYDYYTGATGDFQICITGTPTPTPTNDEPCSAIQLPAVTSTCQYSQFTTVGSTASTGAPTPASCIGGSGAAIGGFSASSHDIWFSITVPSSGNIDVTSQPIGGAGSITDGVMVLYTGTCGALTQVVCSDDHNYPGSSNDLLPFISASGLTPGTTVFVRYFGFGASSGTFGICASTATNDDCINALYICDINGYSASTSASYTEDRPDNMFGNNETAAGVDLTNGVNSGGPFGDGQPWNMAFPFTGSPALDVNIDNNSWIKFTAAATTATLTVSVTDCFTNAGIQMQIFSANNCTNFVPVSNFEESNTGFVITAVGLTIGNDYYLMVDGFAGDICNYTISAESGVQFPEITPVAPICIGGSVTLTAPVGATSYDWAHSGETTQSVTVTPATTQSYSVEVTGLCDYKQTLITTVTVNPLPNVTITNGNNVAICAGDNVNLTASGATSYTWSTSQSGATINVSPSTLTNYTVTGTDGNGCVNTDVIAVSVNALPTMSTNPTATDADCGVSNGSLNGTVISGTPNFGYSWSNGIIVVGTSADLTGMSAGSYTLTVTDGNGCASTFPSLGIQSSSPPDTSSLSISISDNTPCEFDDVIIIASGMSNVTYVWSGNIGSTTGNPITINNINVNQSGQISVTIEDNNTSCSIVLSAFDSIFVNPNPTITITAANNDSTICLNNDFVLTANGATTYVWSGPNGFTGTSSTETITGATNASAGTYTVTGTDANGCINTANIPITILALPSLNLSANSTGNTYCNGFSAILDATGASSYSWTGPNGFTATGTPVNVLSMDANSQGYYIVQGTDSESCVNSDSIFVTVITDVPANAPADITLCPETSLTLYGEGSGSFIWSGPGGFYSTSQNPLVTNDLDYPDAGWYTLTVIDSAGCLGSDSTYVTVTTGVECLYIPNLITPNKDGENDAWVVIGLDQIESAEVSIFNRWGNLVYHASPYDNDWAGEVNKGAVIDGGDGIVPAGTYFYIINLNKGEENDIFKGYIEVEY
ncbi:MAG: gliding motility-associated C-terminal domain-containing protein [Fluviicola sp.]|nr:gliding motility-associated C-terminal domain-containing protein [Fluviicola sp.]